MKNGRHFYSTGAVARILNVSRSTVSRRFDLGQLTGKLNAVTRQRMIASHSLVEFIRKHDLPVPPELVDTEYNTPVPAAPDLREALLDLCRNDDRLAEKALTLLGLPPAPGHEDPPHRRKRRWTRCATDLPATLRMFTLRTPVRSCDGTATVSNICRGGALLSDLKLGVPTIPAEPFRFELSVDRAPLENWQAEARIVRLVSNGSISAGLEFTRLSEQNLKKIAALTRRQAAKKDLPEKGTRVSKTPPS